MTEEQLNNIQNELTTKLGEAKFAEIADTWGKVTAYNKEGNQRYDNLQTELNTVKQSNEALIISNGNLLKQIPQEGATPNQGMMQGSTDEVTEHKFSFKGGLDEKGNFKR